MKKYIADLHIHSKYSRAVSRDMTISSLFLWGRKKGIDLIGTGDFTHPFWVRDLKNDLKSLGNGFYQFKDDSDKKGPFFVLSSEISCIYSQGGKTRKIHLVFLSPSIEIVEKVNQKLSEIGNITSDGRPILGISAQNLVKLILGVSKEIIVIPAHIWTPWFSLFGANSGFDSLEECFGNQTEHIHAIETGLSSEPAMNWQIPDLENLQIISSSDAHSPSKIGREATVIEGEFSYQGLNKALKGDKENKILYTIEFFPEEGKYHYTGHRNCNVRYNSSDLEKKGRVCPVCGKILTVGVVQRVKDLSGKKVITENFSFGRGKVKGIQLKNSLKPPFVMLVPLQEIISEALSVGVKSKKVEGEYEKIISLLGNEFSILLELSKDELKKATSDKIIEGILKVRERNLNIDPGYDGVFGKVKIWGEKIEENNFQDQIALF